MSKILDDTIIEYKTDAKNIIYGKPVSNKYGLFQCMCIPVQSEVQVKLYQTFLRHDKQFEIYDKFIFAHRINITPHFITEEHNQEYLENYQEDDSMEGGGQKLLILLRKFTVENVLIVIGIQQKNVLLNFDMFYFHIIIEKAKDLLNSLYKKLVQNDQIKQQSIYNESEEMKQTFLEFPINNIQQQQAKFQPLRKNYIYAERCPPVQFNIVQKNIDRNEKILIQTKTNIKRWNLEIEKHISLIDHEDYMQMKFLAQYDQNSLIDKVFQILMIIEGIDTKYEFAYLYQMDKQVKHLRSEMMDNQKLLKIKDIIRQNTGLKFDRLFALNPAVANLYNVVFYVMKAYEGEEEIKRIERNKNTQLRLSQIDNNNSGSYIVNSKQNQEFQFQIYQKQVQLQEKLQKQRANVKKPQNQK